MNSNFFFPFVHMDYIYGRPSVIIRLPILCGIIHKNFTRLTCVSKVSLKWKDKKKRKATQTHSHTWTYLQPATHTKLIIITIICNIHIPCPSSHVNGLKIYELFMHLCVFMSFSPLFHLKCFFFSFLFSKSLWLIHETFSIYIL